MDQMRSIFLVGFMGAGKSSIGTAVAARLGSRFIDLDEEISARLGAPIADVFADRGEATFRAAEHDELARISGLEDVVVATGGGAFCNPVNRDLIHRSGAVSVFLDLPWPKLAERLAGDNSERPMYDDADQARRLFDQRMPEYRRAMVRVPLDGTESSAEAAERVVDALQEAPCAT
jgi:shikimate kinase/3-dehydroquinate synthase